MRCTSPRHGWRNDSGELVFVNRGDLSAELTVRCGKCMSCRVTRREEWAVRIMHEAQMHERNSFVTLTYDEEHVPARDDLVHRDFQLFMKRLRQEEYRKWRKAHPGEKRCLRPVVRYFMCGERGERFGRPHFHAILFGKDFYDDAVIFSESRGNRLFTSAELSSLWPHGFSSFGAVTAASAAYVAGYCTTLAVDGERARQKYSRVDESTGEEYQLTPEYAQMSRRPGIGVRWLQKYHADIYTRGLVRVGGRDAMPPRFYDRWIAENLPRLAVEVELDRYLKSQTADPNEASDERLIARDICLRARLSLGRKVL